MPAHLTTRPPRDVREEQQVRKLAHSAYAPAAWLVHARMVARSGDGQRIRQIAQELGCYPQTVRERLPAFNARSLDRLGMKPGSGRRPRLTQLERTTFLTLVRLPPTGMPTYERTGELAAPDPEAEPEPEWTLDTLAAAARERGIWVARGQMRRIFRRKALAARLRRSPTTSPTPPAPPRPSSTAIHSPGSGDVHHRPTATCGAASCVAFEERRNEIHRRMGTLHAK